MLAIDISLPRRDFTLRCNAQIAARGITVLFGPSGAGKTSLLRCIAGLDLRVQGTISLGDDVWLDASTQVVTHRRALGYVFQQGALFPHLNVRDNIAFAQKRAHGQGIPLDEIIRILDVEILLDSFPSQLSGGEQQRVALARVLASGPKLLLMDEPLSSLDQVRKRDLLPYLVRLKSLLAIPILYVTHDMQEVQQLADQLLYLERGEVRAHCPIGDALVDPALPFCQGDDAVALLPAVARHFDEQYQLLTVRSGTTTILLNHGDCPVGTQLRLRIAARDVSVARCRASDSSVLNIVEVTLNTILPADNGQVLLHLDVAGQTLLSRITQRSADTLKLTVGDTLYAQIKGIAVHD